MAKHIILGDGIFAIGGVDLGLTRGGGSFSIEREYREVNADGDMGPVKDRITKVRSVAKLSMNMLEIDDTNLDALFPATTQSTDGATDVTTWEGTYDVEPEHFQSTVTWTGRTKGGLSVVITLENAINLENIEWAMVTKEEIVPAVTYTAVYTEENREGKDGEGWTVEFIPAEE